MITRYNSNRQNETIKNMPPFNQPIKVNTVKIANKNTIPIRVWLKQFIKISLGVLLIIGLTLYIINA